MSKIISKPFNAAHKILRAIFRGSPNLFTTADLNRQIEAFDQRLRNVESLSHSGVVSDLFIGTHNGKVRIYYSYLEVYGCVLYSGSQTFVETEFSSINGLSLVFSTRTLTYSDDATHLISGVKFEDGTSKEAADHVVIDKWEFQVLNLGETEWEELPQGSTRIELCQITGQDISSPTMFRYWNEPTDIPQNGKIQQLNRGLTDLRGQFELNEQSVDSDSWTAGLQDTNRWYGIAQFKWNGDRLTCYIDGSMVVTDSSDHSILIPIPKYESLSWTAQSFHGAVCIHSSSVFSINLTAYERKDTGQGIIDGISVGRYIRIEVVVNPDRIEELYDGSVPIEGTITIFK